MRLRAVLLHQMCFVSGAAGLVYEVVWTRLAALLLGATAPAVAAVLACFMGGLGLGAHVGGHLADRTNRVLHAYGIVELAIATWAAGLVALETGWPLGQHAPAGALRFLLAAIAIIPPTTAMGMTLPLLVRASASARSVSSLYAVNTAGAVLGTLACGFVLIGAFGLRGAHWAAVACNCAAGIAALALGRSARPTAIAAPAPAPRQAPVHDLLIVAALTGLCSMALEVLAARALDLLTFSTVYAFSAILAVFLVGIALGSALCAGRFATLRPTRGTVAFCLALLAVSTMTTPALLAIVASVAGDALRSGSVASTSAALIVSAASVVLVPTLATGAAFPLLGQLYVERRPAVGRGIGAVALANTFGGVLGCLIGGFVLLPFFGLDRGLFAIALLALGGCVLWDGRGPSRARALAAIGSAATLVATIALGVRLPRDLYASLSEQWTPIAMRDDASASVLVASARENPDRIGLWIDGNYVAGTGGGHLLLAHLPMLRHRGPRTVLGACMGTGQTFGTMAEYAIDGMDCVELSPAVVAVARRHFARFDRGLFERRNVAIHVDDVRRFLEPVRSRYDVVAAEPLQPWTRGAVALYSQDYYLAVRRALRPHGIAVQWLPLYEVSGEDLRGIVATFRSVFREVEMWLDHHDVILLGSRELPAMDPTAIAVRIAAPHVKRDLAALHITNVETLLSTRVLGPRAGARFAQGARIITDADPYLEMTAPRALGQSTEWQNLHDLVRAWDIDWRGVPGGAGLAKASHAAREEVRIDLADHAGRPGTTDDYLRALSIDPHHSRLFARAAGRVARDARAGDPRSIERYREIVRLRPDFGEAWINLGKLLVDADRIDEAERAFEVGAARSPAVRPVALFNLGALHARRGEWSRAREMWTELKRLTPEDPRVEAMLARLPPLASPP